MEWRGRLLLASRAYGRGREVCRRHGIDYSKPKPPKLLIVVGLKLQFFAETCFQNKAKKIVPLKSLMSSICICLRASKKTQLQYCSKLLQRTT